jgi:hypothetical protein
MVRTPAQDQLRDQAARNALALLARRLLQFYWLTCLAIIAMGAFQLHPEWGEKVRFALRDPALELKRPFPTCIAAHNAGYFNIPRASRAYVERQDEDKNGRACEPYPGYPPDRMARLRLIEQRLMAP